MSRIGVRKQSIIRLHSSCIQEGLEIKVVVVCEWTEAAISMLQNLVESKYSFSNRLKDNSDEILKEIKLLLEPRKTDVEEIYGNRGYNP